MLVLQKQRNVIHSNMQFCFIYRFVLLEKMSFYKRLSGVGLESGLMCKTFKGHVLTIFSKNVLQTWKNSIFLSQGILCNM